MRADRRELQNVELQKSEWQRRECSGSLIDFRKRGRGMVMGDVE